MPVALSECMSEVPLILHLLFLTSKGSLNVFLFFSFCLFSISGLWGTQMFISGLQYLGACDMLWHCSSTSPYACSPALEESQIRVTTGNYRGKKKKKKVWLSFSSIFIIKQISFFLRGYRGGAREIGHK